MSPDPRPPVSDQTPTPNIVCRSCGNGHHRKYQRGEAMEPCPHCGSSALRFLVPGELSPAAAPAPTPEPEPAPAPPAVPGDRPDTLRSQLQERLAEASAAYDRYPGDEYANGLYTAYEVALHLLTEQDVQRAADAQPALPAPDGDDA